LPDGQVKDNNNSQGNSNTNVKIVHAQNSPNRVNNTQLGDTLIVDILNLANYGELNVVSLEFLKSKWRRFLN